MTITCNTSVIICAYTVERWQDLVAAVESLHRQTQQPGEIILIIDHNADLFGRARKSFQNVIVAENEAAPGLSGARNTGIALAHGEYIIFLDDDAEAAPDWLEHLVNDCKEPHILGVGGTVLPRWQGKAPAWFPSEFYWVIGCTYHARSANPIVVRNPYGGCTCIKREVFLTIGGFREGIGRVGPNCMGGEETELSIRAAHRWPEKVFLYEPRAFIYHHIPAKRARLDYFLSRCYAEGLSKALISKCVGSRDGLSSERRYTLAVLPLGVLKNISEALIQQDPHGFLRAGAILLGLIMTTAGYFRGGLQSASLPATTYNAENIQIQISKDDATQISS